MLSITFLLVFHLVILSIYLYFKHAFSYWKRKGIPYIHPKFPSGNITLSDLDKKSPMEQYHNLYKDLYKKSKNFGGFYGFTIPVFMPLSPELVKTILTKDFNYFPDRGYYYDDNVDPLSANLVNLRLEKWKIVRSKVSPNYTGSKIKMMFQTLLECSNELENILDEACENNQPIDTEEIMDRFTVDNLVTCSFGLGCKSLRNPDDDFLKYGRFFSDTSLSDIKWLIAAALFPWFFRFFRISLTHKSVSHFFLNTLKQTIEYREKNKIQRKDFLDYYLNKNDKDFTFNEIAAQVFVIYIAGADTSSSTLTFCLLHLALDQKIQDKVREEIEEVLNKHEGNITYDAIMEMTYMDKVMNETLRMYPPISFLNRECTKTYTIPETDITIEKGTPCFVSITGIHKNPDFYPDPEKFDPERFSEEEKAKRHPFTFIPFGEGPRICLGVRFGIVQVKLGLTRLLRNHKFHLDTKMKCPVDLHPKSFITKPREKIWLRVEKLE